jgi:hypothetical protein
VLMYLITSIKETLFADPRVRDVSGIRLRGEGDALHIECSIDTAANRVEYAGRA